MRNRSRLRREPKAQETKSGDRGRGQRDNEIFGPLRTLTTAEAPRKAHIHKPFDVFASSKPELELDQDRGLAAVQADDVVGTLRHSESRS